MKRPEQALQIQVANYFRVALKPPTIWTAIGHGGGGKVRGAILKAMGVQPGWPDILVISPSIVIGLEMKAKGGRPSPYQDAVAHSFHQIAALYFICKSVGDVQFALERSGIPLHARLS